MKFNQIKVEETSLKIEDRVEYFKTEDKKRVVKYGTISNFYYIDSKLYCNLEEEGSALFRASNLTKVRNIRTREEEIKTRISFIKGNIKFLKYKMEILSPNHPDYKKSLIFFKTRILKNKKIIIDLKIKLLEIKGEKNV